MYEISICDKANIIVADITFETAPLPLLPHKLAQI